MRNFMKSSVLVLTLAAAAGAALAQAPQDQPQGPHPHGQFQGRQQNPEFEIKMLTRRLSLTPEQAAQIEPILADRKARMEALRPASGSQPDFKALRQQHKQIMDDTKARIDAVLTPDQQAKFKERPGARGPRGNWKQQGGSTPSA